MMNPQPHVFTSADLYCSEYRRKLIAEERREFWRELFGWAIAAGLMNLVVVAALLASR